MGPVAALATLCRTLLIIAFMLELILVNHSTVNDGLLLALSGLVPLAPVGYMKAPEAI